MIKRIILFLLICLFKSVLFISAQTHNVPLSNSANLDILRSNELKAKEYVSKNLNRFAIERLQKYNFLLDSLYLAEKKDTLNQIEIAYRLNSVSKKSKIDSLSTKISELSLQKEKQETQYSSLVKKALLSFLLWVTIVLAILQFRKRRLIRVKAKLQSTNVQLLTLEITSKNAINLSNNFKSIKEPLHKLSGEFARLNNLIAEYSTNEKTPNEWPEISTKANTITKALDKEEKILNLVLAQTESAKEEKITTDINNLCDQYLEIASRGIQKTNEFNCLITRDFEKKIAPIHVNPSAIGSLLLNVLTNAFQSVMEQNKKGIKGYQPKVSVSTRILPRFLQIRIKDNGTGFKESVLKNATNEFFSTRSLQDGSGLGLYIANNIITEMHKGEIKIESEEGASTDVYIKFFI